VSRPTISVAAAAISVAAMARWGGATVMSAGGCAPRRGDRRRGAAGPWGRRAAPVDVVGLLRRATVRCSTGDRRTQPAQYHRRMINEATCLQNAPDLTRPASSSIASWSSEYLSCGPPSPAAVPDEPDRVDQRPAAEGHPQPRPVPVRAGRVESVLPRGAQPRPVPQPERRDEKLGLEESIASVHDLLRRTHPTP
jgi:hypothetical protein